MVNEVPFSLYEPSIERRVEIYISVVAREDRLTDM